MKSIRKLLLTVTILLAATLGLCGSSFGWLNKTALTVDGKVKQATVIRQYFHCGDGSRQDPYVITRPIHYYHLVELYQRKNSVVAGKYFQLGYDLDPDTPGLEVYDYDDLGNVKMDGNTPMTSTSLNMAYYSEEYALIPVGTSAVPFDGQFEGNGLEIRNINIRASETISTEEHFASADIGIFGYVSGEAKISDTYFSDVTIDLTGCDAGQTHAGHNSSHHADGVVYAGYLAGHVKESASIQNVFLNNCTITGAESVAGGTEVVKNLYGYIGCVEHNDGTLVETLGESIASQFGGGGSDPGWGNTVNMKNMFNRLYAIARAHRNDDDVMYPSVENLVVEVADDVRVEELTSASDFEYVKVLSREVAAMDDEVKSHPGYSLEYIHHGDDIAGSYYFNIANGYNPWIYLTGRNSYQTKTVNIYIAKDVAGTEAYFICDEAAKNYMSASSGKTIVNTSRTDASRWMKDPSNHLYTFIGATAYYLNASGLSMTLSDTSAGATQWTIDENGISAQIYAVTSGVRYYLNYNDVWQLTAETPTYSVSDGSGHYMGTGGMSVTTETSVGASASWEIDDGSAGVQFKTYVNGTPVYLAHIGGKGLTLSPTAFRWTKSTGSEPFSYTADSDGRTWYLAYDDGWKTVVTGGKSIVCESSGTEYYLAADKAFEGVTAGQAETYISLWDMDLSADSTAIALYYNGVTYSLDADVASGEVFLRVPDTEEPATVWYKDAGGHYYVQDDSAPFYLTYDGKWCVKTSSTYFIKCNGNYLAFDAGQPFNVGNVTSQSAGSNRWVFENPGGTGLVYINSEGTAYYLNIRTVNGQKLLSLDYEHAQIVNDQGVVVDQGWSAAQAVRWTGDSRGYFAVCDGDEYYLRYESGWRADPVDYTYKAATVSNNYLAHSKNAGAYSVYSYTGTDTSAADIRWKSDGEYIWFIDNDTRHYLAFGSAGAGAVISDTPCRWQTTCQTGSGAVKNILNTVHNNVRYRLDCEGGSWITSSLDTETVLFTDGTGAGKGYLCADQYTAGSMVTRTADATDPGAHWIYESGSIYQYHSGQKYYLNLQTATGTGYRCLYVSTSKTSTWQDDEEFPGAVYTSFCGIRHVIYKNGSSMQGLPASWKVICSGTNYLTANSSYTGIANGTSTSTGRDWYFSGTTAATIYTMNAGVQYYLRWTGTALTLTDSASASGITWNVGTDSIRTQDGYTLTYESTTGWTCKKPTGGWVIADDSETHFMKLNGSSVTDTTDPAQATFWSFTDSTNHTGKIYSGSSYLGVNKSTHKLTVTNSSNAVSWAWRHGSYHYYSGTAGDKSYQMGYVSDFQNLIYGDYNPIINIAYRQDDGSFVYLGQGLTAVTSKADAANFKFTSWGKDFSGNITSQDKSSNKYLCIKYLDSSQGYMPGWNSTGSSSVAWWSNMSTLNNDRQAIRSKSIGNNATDCYLRYKDGKWSGGRYSSDKQYLDLLVKYNVRPVNIDVPVAGAQYRTEYRDGTYEAVSANVQKKELWYGTETAVVFVPVSGFADVTLSVLELNTVEIREPAIGTVPSVMTEEKEIRRNSRVLRTTAQELYGPYTRTNQLSGYDTYIPLRLKLQDEEDETSYYSDYRIDSRNTGYIVSGGYQTSGGYRSDIRVSDYDTSYIYKALNVGSSSSPNYSGTYDARLSVITRTAYSSGDNTDGEGGTGKVYGDNGYVRIDDKHNHSNIGNYHGALPDDALNYAKMGLTKYEVTDDGTPQSRNALADMLMGDNEIYGLHFMESTISKNHVIYADNATILGNTYQNYELPEDSIDFKVKDRGAINFFAGTYYSDDVEAFFSLHHIQRDSNQHITAIREIRKIYQRGSKAYVYEYSDGTYSDGSSGPETGSKMLFDTEWITDPEIVQNAVYYFEIPVNRGEYALGSVPGKVGAYLMYLDIATRGGDESDDRISSEGSGVSNMYRIDYRDAGGTLDHTSLLQFEINAPAENKSSEGKAYSVSMNYQTITGSDIIGLYTLTVINRTGQPLDLTMFVCDNDDNPDNDYPYAYTVNYVSNSGSGTLVGMAKTCEEYIVPE